MISVNTNVGAMAALRTLTATNTQLAQTQQRVNSGLNVSSTKDNSAKYTMAQQLRGDVLDLDAMDKSLKNAKSTLDVAVSGAEQISDILNKMKSMTVQAQDADTETTSLLQSDFNGYTDQIRNILASSSFNGANLLDGGSGANSSLSATISLQGGDGESNSLDFERLTVDNQNLRTALVDILDPDGDPATKDYLAINDAGAGSYGYYNSQVNNSINDLFNNEPLLSQPGETYEFMEYNSGKIFTDKYLIGSVYTGDIGLAINLDGIGSFEEGRSLGNFPPVSNSSSGGAIEKLEAGFGKIQDALSTLGSASRRIDDRIIFNSKLSDTITSGIGNLVDADMAKESATLQSLQVKQQLGVQALSIANQAPQILLSLFGGGGIRG